MSSCILFRETRVHIRLGATSNRAGMCSKIEFRRITGIAKGPGALREIARDKLDAAAETIANDHFPALEEDLANKFCRSEKGIGSSQAVAEVTTLLCQDTFSAPWMLSRRSARQRSSSWGRISLAIARSRKKISRQTIRDCNWATLLTQLPVADRTSAVFWARSCSWHRLSWKQLSN